MLMQKLEIDGHPYHGIVHLYNSHATSAEQMNVARQKIVDYFPKLEHVFIETLTDSDQTIKDLDTATEPDYIVCVQGGEATVNLAAKARSNSFFSEFIIPHFILPGGNKNDLANSLYAEDVLDNPNKTMRSAYLEAIYPIEFFTQSSSEESVRRDLAISYGGVGSIAEVCRLLNDRRKGLLINLIRAHKSSKFILELYNTINGLTVARPFSTIDHKNGDKPAKLVELSYINGNRMAGGVIVTPVEAFDMQAVRVKHKYKAGLMMELTELALSASVGVVDEIDDDFTVTSPVMLHVDAEHRQLTPGTRVQVRRSAQPFHVLSTL